MRLNCVTEPMGQMYHFLPGFNLLPIKISMAGVDPHKQGVALNLPHPVSWQKGFKKKKKHSQKMTTQQNNDTEERYSI